MAVNKEPMTGLCRQAAENCSTETLRHFLFQNGLRHPEKPAYQWYDETSGTVTGVSYRELMGDILALGTAFYAHGWKGRNLGIIAGTDYTWVLTFLTCVCGDMRALPLDPNLEPEELLRRLNHCGTNLALTDRRVREALLPHINTEHPSAPESTFRFLVADDLKALLKEGQDLLAAGDTRWPDDFVGDSQPALMIFTSGTGGKMKAAVIRQENLTAERFVWKGLEADRSTCLLTLPLFHIAGIGDLRGTVLVGTTAFLSGGLRSLLRDYTCARPVTAFMVPAQAELICSLLRGRSPEEAREMLGGNLVALRTSGAPMPENLRRQFAGWGIDVTSDYGMTETCGPVSVSVMKNGRLFSKPGSVGRILDCLRVRIDNPDENGRGEVLIAGPSVFSGYLGDPAETEAILHDGWLHTGDLGYIDEDCYLFLVGRKKNILVLSSGENVIPEELESVISAIPGVRECLVREENGSLAALIYTGPAAENQTDEDLLHKEIEQRFRGFPTYKRIRTVHLAPTPLPRTATGKLLRTGG